MGEATPFQEKPFDRAKFKEMILYFAERSAELGDEGFGMVKLNKLLYRADFEAFRLLGHSITGETYERQEFGPVARGLPIVLDELGADGRLGWQHIPTGPFTRDVPGVSHEQDAAPDRSQFDEAELQILERTLDELAEYGGKAVSKWSHEKSAGWLAAETDGTVIEYGTALISTAPIPEKDLNGLAQMAHERGWVEASS